VLFVIFVVIGVCSIPFFIVGIELGVALTRNPDESASVLWLLCVPSFLSYRQIFELLFSKWERSIHPLCDRSASHILPSALRRHFTHLAALFTTSTSLFAVQSALRASPTESPPLNMRHAITFNSDWVLSGFHFVFIIGEKQLRRRQDERTDEEQRTQGTSMNDIATLPPQEGPTESVKE
jgi:hypothetical protein